MDVMTYHITTESNRDICAVHLINDGIVITGNTVELMWQVTGPDPDNRVDTTLCSLDGGDFATCKKCIIVICSYTQTRLMHCVGTSPHTIAHLSNGSHRVDIQPDNEFNDCAMTFTTSIDFNIVVLNGRLLLFVYTN